MAAVSNRDVTAAMLSTDNEDIHGAGLENVGGLTSHNPMGLHGLLQE
jgi:hypothetical protein